jgi:hypothetical protein
MDTQEQATEEATDRRELLAQQFSEVEAAPEAPQPVESQVPDDPEPEPEEPKIWAKPPSSWKKDYHDAWESVDPKVREYIWQREDETRAGIEPLKTKAQFAEQMQKAAEPYMQTIQQLGVDLPTAISGLMDADHNLRYGNPQQKRAYLNQLAQQYGVNLGDAEGFQQEYPADPYVSQLQSELYSIKNELVGWKQQQEAAKNESLQAEIEEFSSKAEFFEDAKPTMITLLQSGVASTLQDAYEKALRLDNDLFERVQQSQQAAAEAAKRKAADQAAKSAKAAAVSVRTSTPRVPTATNAQDRRSMLMSQFNDFADRL